MSFDLTILNKKIEGLKEAYESGRYGDALVASLNTGNGLLQQRVFTENKDVNGNDFGKYIGKTHKAKLLRSKNRTEDKRLKALAGQDLTSYQRKRLKNGRQINKKDLEFSGGTRRAIETRIENEKSAVLEFNNDEAAKIARGQENQITNIRNGQTATTKGDGIKIFRLNQLEKEQVIEQGVELIKQILKPK